MVVYLKFHMLQDSSPSFNTKHKYLRHYILHLDDYFIFQFNEYKTFFDEAESKLDTEFEKELIYSYTIRVTSKKTLQDIIFYDIPSGLGDCSLYDDKYFVYAKAMIFNIEEVKENMTDLRKCLDMLESIKTDKDEVNKFLLAHTENNITNTCPKEVVDLILRHV